MENQANGIDLIKKIVEKKSWDFSVYEHDGWIIITASTLMGQHGNVAKYWIEALIDGEWYNVDHNLQIRLSGFGITQGKKDGLRLNDVNANVNKDECCKKWMENHFAKFEMVNIPSD